MKNGYRSHWTFNDPKSIILLHSECPKAVIRDSKCLISMSAYALLSHQCSLMVNDIQNIYCVTQFWYAINSLSVKNMLSNHDDFQYTLFSAILCMTIEKWRQEILFQLPIWPFLA